MAGHLSFIHNRVARRILISFILAAMVPVAILGILSFQQVSEQIRNQTEKSLQKASKEYGLRLIDRLTLCESSLRLVASNINTSTKDLNHLPSTLTQKLKNQFNDVALMATHGELISLVNQNRIDLKLNQNEVNHISSGKTSIIPIIDGKTQSFQLWIAIPFDEQHPNAVLIGKTLPEVIWEDEYLGLYDLWVFDETGQQLFSSLPTLTIPGEIRTRFLHNVSGTITWQKTDTTYLGAFWKIPLGNVFAAPEMVVVQAQPETLAFASIDLFSRIYPPVIFLAILIVALLSSRLINKYLTPLENLKTATIKIAQGDLNYQVNIDSRDEFETLGASFNKMTQRLRNQFDIQAMMSEIDRSILSSLNAETITEIALHRLPELLGCDLMAIIRLDTASHRIQHIHVKLAKHPAETLPINKQLSPATITQLSLRQYDIIDSNNTEATDFINLLGIAENWRLLLIPILLEGKIAAVMCLGYQAPKLIPPELITTAINFGDRLAVALSNAAWEEKLYKQAHFDSLTGLPNRLVLNDNLNQELARARRDESQVAVIFIDLDHFKKINDSLGHLAGDELLAKVSEIFVICVRETDLVVRLGGDEFVIVINGLKSQPQSLSKISIIAETILTHLKKPIIVAGYPVTFSASLGIALFPNDADNAQDLLKNADTAMYHAKSEGRGNFKFYSNKLNETALENITLEHELRNAIPNNELLVYYQPKVNLAGHIVGAEALVRWQHPKLGMVSPGKFIPLAEQTGLIVDIGDWVFEHVCNWANLHITKSRRDFRISINLSGIQFKHPDLITKIAKIMTKTRVNPSCIELELTESISIGDIETCTQRMNELKGLGLTLAMDDFGTGFSSLSYLKMMPLDVLKIDQSFVRPLESTTNSRAIVQAIIALANGLNMEIVAEGVETLAQFELLKQYQCPIFQGFLFSRPIPSDEFLTLILNNVPLIASPST